MGAEDRLASTTGDAVFPQIHREATALVKRDHNAAEETRLGGVDPVELGKILGRGRQLVGVEGVEPDDCVHASSLRPATAVLGGRDGAVRVARKQDDLKVVAQGPQPFVPVAVPPIALQFSEQSSGDPLALRTSLGQPDCLGSAVGRITLDNDVSMCLHVGELLADRLLRHDGHLGECPYPQTGIGVEVPQDIGAKGKGQVRKARGGQPLVELCGKQRLRPGQQRGQWVPEHFVGHGITTEHGVDMLVGLPPQHGRGKRGSSQMSTHTPPAASAAAAASLRL
jgi:hypothetical protein